MSDERNTQPLEPPFVPGETVMFRGKPATVHQVSGDVIELAVEETVTNYVTVSKDSITRGN